MLTLSKMLLQRESHFFCPKKETISYTLWAKLITMLVSLLAQGTILPE